MKRKSANLTPKKTKKKSLRSNDTFNHFVLRKMNPKRRTWFKKRKKMFWQSTDSKNEYFQLFVTGTMNGECR